VDKGIIEKVLPNY